MTLRHRILANWKCPGCKLNYTNKRITVENKVQPYIECFCCKHIFDLDRKDITKEIKETRGA